MSEKAKVLIEFKGKGAEDAAHAFLVWLCEQGEQDYWQWNDSDEGTPTAYKFDYNFDRLRADASQIEDSGSEEPNPGNIRNMSPDDPELELGRKD